RSGARPFPRHTGKRTRRGDLKLAISGDLDLATCGYFCTATDTCSQRYRDHEAFQQTVELSVAIDASCRGLGVGTSLYRALFESIPDEPIHVAVVGIAMPNDASVALHRKFGFTQVGTFHEYAAKNGQYISSLWMERLL
ncbi:GNAT family N-acetyltransferase, partial [Acrocarpospora catenulata]|uniref:GNAT family N-acetyltransferase n=1 Tax=Acrocarpospora catenulata TaxID=2836182 RepID=UPI001BDAF7D5